MAYALTWFDDFIADLQAPAGRNTSDLLKNYESTIEMIDSQMHTARKRMKAAIFEFNDPQHITNYVRMHLLAAVEHANDLATLMSREEMLSIYSVTASPCFANIYKTTHRSLEVLKNFLERQLPQDPERALPVPAVNRLLEARLIEERLPYLKADLLNAGVGERLTEIALTPFTDFIRLPPTATSDTITISYLKELLAVLLKLLESDEMQNEDPQRAMIVKLYYMNLNSFSFLEYCQDYIIKDLLLHTTRADRDRKLGWYIKINSQYFLRPFMALYPGPGKPSIKYMLEIWLNHEADWLLLAADESKETGEDEKMPTTLPVTVMALMFRLFQLNRNLNPPTDIYLVRFVCQHFSSIHTKEMQTENFRKRLYEKDPATFKALRSFLHDIIKLSHDYEKGLI